jgi:hypothetical protein
VHNIVVLPSLIQSWISLEMAATLAVAELPEAQFRRELHELLDTLGHGHWRPLTLRERALLRRAHLLV